MPQMWKSEDRLASEMMQDDWFDLGGHRYRVSSAFTEGGATIIRAYIPSDASDSSFIFLTIASGRIVQVYNQK